MATAASPQHAQTPRVPGTPSAPLSTRHPKTGDRRSVRRSLRLHPSKPRASLPGTPDLDCLPLALLDRIRNERAQRRTSTPASQNRACRGPRPWHEIECDSPLWPEWEQATPEVLAAFPDRRLPHSNLHRWHDLRVEQVQRERDGQVLAAPALADRLAALRNALSESIFRLALQGAGEQLLQDDAPPSPAFPRLRDESRKGGTGVGAYWRTGRG